MRAEDDDENDNVIEVRSILATAIQEEWVWIGIDTDVVTDDGGHLVLKMKRQVLSSMLDVIGGCP